MNYRKLFLFLCLLPLIAGAQNITGRITCDGRGIKGVAVSDGDVVTTTDKDGHYALESKKRNGYVFYSIPRGYEAEIANGFNPQFWQTLTSPSTAVAEQHDFRLRKVRNNEFRFLIGTDVHLARRADDVDQFRRLFIPCLAKEHEAAGGAPIYSMMLGDLAWDIYWTQNDFNLQDFQNALRESGYDVPLFPVMGNHDNDPSVSPTPQTDFLSSGPWRKIMCPNYYSYNLGRVHVVVLDDIVYKNEDTGAKYAKGVVGSRNYDGVITDEQFEWLRQDLALVSRNTPIIIGLHIPTTKIRPDDFAVKSRLGRNSTERLFEMLKHYKTVHIVSGHTHINADAHPEGYPNIMEHNLAAVCATWWNSGLYTGRHLCTDGTPGGYSLWKVKGRKLRWQYHSMEENGNLQMRVLDMNAVRDFYRNTPAIKDFLTTYPDRTDYGKVEPNMIYVNVFAYDTNWKVEVFEDGKPLSVTRERAEDPMHTLAFDLPAFIKTGSSGSGSQTRKSLHMFVAQAHSEFTPVKVRVTDAFGQVYTSELRRPGKFDLSVW